MVYAVLSGRCKGLRDRAIKLPSNWDLNRPLQPTHLTRRTGKCNPTKQKADHFSMTGAADLVEDEA